MIFEAIDRYHSLLTDQVAQDSHDRLRASLSARGLYFGERPLCRVLRPHFYLQADWEYLKHETEVLLSAFSKAHAACLSNADLRAQLALEPYEESLFSLDKGMDFVPWTSSRLDAFFRSDEGYLRFVEYNAETPAGIGYGDELSAAFLELEVMKRFQQFYTVIDMPGQGQLLQAILRAYKGWGGQGKPQIAIVDWSDVPTLSEHEIIRRFFERHELRAVLADPRNLDYRDRHLWAGDFRVDLIYKRVLCSELIQRMGIENPIVRALRDRAVLMTNSFSAKLLSKKASLAFLSDEQNHNLFNEREINVITAHIPWTRRVSERKTFYQGREIDLLPFIAEHQEKFVLKPNDEYGGKGVIIGWECSAEVWNKTLHDALTMPYVVQERVNVVYRDFPMLLDDGRLDISPRFVDANPYVYDGNTVGGCLTRLSSMALLNVTAGGGSVVPTFVLQKRAV